jgi:hypothetical protein
VNWNAWKADDVLSAPFDGKNPGVAVPFVEKMTPADETAAVMLKRPRTKKSFVIFIRIAIMPCPVSKTKWNLGTILGPVGAMTISYGSNGRWAAARDVQTASGIVGVDIVEPTVAAHFSGFEHLIRARGGGVLGQHDSGRDGE